MTVDYVTGFRVATENCAHCVSFRPLDGPPGSGVCMRPAGPVFDPDANQYFFPIAMVCDRFESNHRGAGLGDIK